jgi:type IV pilus biogenesis protein CpaD/CtpE
MSFTRETAMRLAKPLLIATALTLGLAGCVESQRHLSQDFGSAVRQDVVAQVADPEARYKGVPAPGSDGARVGLAQERYRTGKVIAPSEAGASTVGASSGMKPQ